MHLQLNLSNQLIKQWNPKLTVDPAETHPLLQWRIDKIKLANTTANYICVNEATLFSFLLPKLPGKKQSEMLHYFTSRLLVFLEDYFFPLGAAALLDDCPIKFGKTTSSKLTASVTNLRLKYDKLYSMKISLTDAETMINRTPLKSLNFRYPLEKFLTFRDQVDDPTCSMLTFRMPASLFYAAHNAFIADEPPALLCFKNSPEEEGSFMARVTLMDLMVFHDKVMNLMEQPITFEIKKKLFPVSAYLKDILSKMP